VNPSFNSRRHPDERREPLHRRETPVASATGGPRHRRGDGGVKVPRAVRQRVPSSDVMTRGEAAFPSREATPSRRHRLGGPSPRRPAHLPRPRRPVPGLRTRGVRRLPAGVGADQRRARVRQPAGGDRQLGAGRARPPVEPGLSVTPGRPCRDLGKPVSWCRPGACDVRDTGRGPPAQGSPRIIGARSDLASVARRGPAAPRPRAWRQDGDGRACPKPGVGPVHQYRRDSDSATHTGFVPPSRSIVASTVICAPPSSGS
jgi:hypothetical protein